MSFKAARLSRKPSQINKERQREAWSRQEPPQRLLFPQPETPQWKPMG